MVVTTVTSNRGAYKILTSSNATLSSAISDVINELENINVSGDKVEMDTIHDGTNFVVLAYVKLGSGGAPYS